MSSLTLVTVAAFGALVVLVAGMLAVFARRNPWLVARPGAADPRIAELVAETRRLADRVEALAAAQARLAERLERERP